MDAINYNFEKQHKKGKLHAIERIKKILDENTFCEVGRNIGAYKSEYEKENSFLYDGVITGYGYINQKLVYIYSQDFTICGGTVGKKHGEKIAFVLKKAIENGCPIIGINDSGGARIQEGVNSLAAYGEIFYLNTLASGYIPQVSIILGPCAGGAVYSPGIMDFIFMVNDISHMFVTGPKVIQEVTGKKYNVNELGGAEIHQRLSGVSHFTLQDETTCFEKVRQLIQIIPSCANEKRSIQDKYYRKHFTGIDKIMPSNPKRVYDVKKIIYELVDNDSFLEIQQEFAKNIVIGLAKICGITIGVIANQPQILAGVLDCDASDKAARFVRYCDAYNIPIITLVDVPGFMPSIEEEKKGIIRHGAKILFAYSEATTSKITVILRKAFGGAYIAMGSKHLGADFVYSWPNAQIAVMGAEGAVNVIYNNEMQQMTVNEQCEFKNSKIAEYEKIHMSSLVAEREGYIDKVIDPKETRQQIFKDILCLQNKRAVININRKHSNIPL